MSLTWLFADRSAKSGNAASVALKNLRVASPCSADWAKMSGDDRVRHCSECKLNVYNLSEMSRRDAEELIASREGRLCVRFYQRADGTVLTRDCPVGLRQLIRRASRVAGTALSALMSVGFCVAQATPNSPAQTTAQNEQKGTGLRVTVVDPAGAVISGAQVFARDTATGVRYTAMTDASGIASLPGLKPGSYEVEIGLKGFKTYRSRTEIKPDKIEPMSVQLTVSGEVIGVLIVTDNEGLFNRTNSTVTHTFEGDLLKAGSPR